MHYICVVVTLSFLVSLVMGMQDWNFVLHRFDYNSSNLDLMTVNVRSTRKQPGIYALNGTFVLGIDIDEKFNVEVKIYRSPNGSGQYKLTPYHVQRKSYCDFIENFYVPMVQDDLKPCSNLPVFEDKCDKPIGKGNYVLDMCLISNGGMPSHIQPGFYKIVAQVQSEDLEFWITLIAEAEPKGIDGLEM